MIGRGVGRSYYLKDTTNWRALTGLGVCDGGPAMSHIAMPVKIAVRNVWTAMGFC
jgi:hypothetical protein